MKKCLIVAVAMCALLFSSAAFAFDFGSLLGFGGEQKKEEKKQPEVKAGTEDKANKAMTGDKAEKNELDAIMDSINQAKKLAEQTRQIRKEMNEAISRVRYLQGVSGKAVFYMAKSLQLAGDSDKAALAKQKEMGGMYDFKRSEANSLKESATIAHHNSKQNKALLAFLKDNAERFSSMRAKEIKSLNALKNSVAQTKGLCDGIASESLNVVVNIDKAVNAFKEKSKPLTIEAAKSVAILTAHGLVLTAQIQQIGSNPLSAIALVPQLKSAYTEISSLVTIFNDYMDDYNFIEDNSEMITSAGKSINEQIIVARRKNTQINDKLVAIGVKAGEITKMSKAMERVQVADLKQNQQTVLAEMSLDLDEQE